MSSEIHAPSSNSQYTLSKETRHVQPGTHLGPYEIVAPIGAGGMGEVYRARDTRLGRDVAIKVLPPEFADDPERLRRFEQEARAVAALSHPNVLAIFDVGTHEGIPYLVTELLEGESLRDRLKAGGLTVRKAVETAVQIAQGLAAAHEKGIVHRDLKPGNVFVTRDGQVKILDFGLAKLVAPRSVVATAQASTVVEATDAGTTLGTVGYMSPEQVLGKPLDSRSDLFSLGVVLYEMLSGKRPFQKDTAPETMAAILKEEPPELAGTGKPVPPGLERIVRHCLEKEPSNRFQSACDIAFDLESLSQATTAETPPLPAPGRRRRLAIVALGFFLLVGSYASLYLWTRQSVKAPLPSFMQITFRRGIVDHARFTPDAQSVVYSASWEGRPREVFSQRLGTADARSFGLAGAWVVGTSGGELAVVLKGGTLARVPLEGGSPREIAEGVASAAWSPDGSQFVIVRAVENRQRLEYPIGKVLYETSGIERLSLPRVSPNGDLVAFEDHRAGVTEVAGQASVVVVDPSGRRRELSKGWNSLTGLAWSPDAREIWFTASGVGSDVHAALHAVTLEGRERLVARVPGNLDLQDIARDGRVLLDHRRTRIEMWGRMAGDSADRDLTWLGQTLTTILSDDGTKMVFQEAIGGGGAYFRRMDGSPPVRLGDCTPLDVSTDWKSVLCAVFPKMELKIVPIGAGETKTLPRGSIETYDWAYFHPDGKRIVVPGSEAGRPTRLFIQDLQGGLPRPFSPEGVSIWGGGFSPDGQYFAARPPGAKGPYVLYPIEGGDPRPIRFLGPEDEFGNWTPDGRWLFVFEHGATARITRLDVRTGQRQLWLELAPSDPTGVELVEPWWSPNGRYYAYRFGRDLSDLYLVEGLK